jgi:hypothetical protein
MFIRVLVIIVGLTTVFGCSTGTSPSETASPLGPSSVSDLPRASVPIGDVARAVGLANVMVTIHDECDPETFNAALGPGTCVGNGTLTFADFIDILTKRAKVNSWHFSPKVVEAQEGKFLVTNLGGEVHTFTEVEEFGGGIVPQLNELAHLPTVAPECLSLTPGDFIAPGNTFEDEIEPDEQELYQCCIHPWMRLSTRVPTQTP